MHYYQHHIGDFIRDTSRLTDQQSMAYLRLLWLYYESEQPLKNPQAVAFKIGVDQPLVELLLQAFFKPDGEAWRHTRCDAEIAAYHQICQRNRDNGVKGGRPKKTQSVSSGNPDAPQTEPMRNPTVTLSSIHDPVSINQERDIGDATAPLTKTVTVKMLVSEGVEKQIAEDWLTLRKAKRLPLTHTAWADTKAEGEKVGLTPAQTVAHAVSSNWAGFKASWYAKESGNTERPMSFAQQEDQARRKRWEEMTGRKWPDENPVLEIFDVKELE